MGQFYTIKAVKPTGWDPDDHGNVVDSVTLEGEAASVLWRHATTTEIAAGQSHYGRIEPAKSGKAQWFKREQQPEDGVDTPSNASQTSVEAPTSGFKAGDGAKQGMAINNAVIYVSSMLNGERLPPEEFAEQVKEYAAEIYKLDITRSNTDDEILAFMAE